MLCFCVHEMVLCHFTSIHFNSAEIHVQRPPEQEVIDEIIAKEHGGVGVVGVAMLPSSFMLLM